MAQRQSAGRLSGRSDDVTLKKRFHVEKKYEKGISWHGSGLWCAVEKNPGKKNNCDRQCYVLVEASKPVQLRKI